jgi:hypothetical protein
MQLTLELITKIVESGIFLHVVYILTIFMLFLDKRKAQLILDLSIEKNLKMGDQLDGMRNELK